jgi:hypothetical protein
VTPNFQAALGESFVVNGAAPPHDLALVTAGSEWRLADRSRGAPGSAKPRDFLRRQSRMVGFTSR